MAGDKLYMYPGRELDIHRETGGSGWRILSKIPGTQIEKREKKGKSMQSTAIDCDDDFKV